VSTFYTYLLVYRFDPCEAVAVSEVLTYVVVCTIACLVCQMSYVKSLDPGTESIN